jgi:integrase
MISAKFQPDLSPNKGVNRPKPREGFIPNPKAKLRAQVHEVMRFHHYSARTEEAYWGWIRRYLVFCRGGADGARQEPCPTGWRHPRELGAAEVQAYLSHLATERNVGASTQNQALNALVFLYGEVLHQPLGEVGEFARAQRPARVPEVLSRGEVARVLAAVDKAYALPLQLMYGSGLRVMELARLRVKELDVERRQITVRDGKGFKDRVTMVPEKRETFNVERSTLNV